MFFPEMIASGERVKKKYPALTVSGASEYYHPLVDELCFLRTPNNNNFHYSLKSNSGRIFTKPQSGKVNVLPQFTEQSEFTLAILLCLDHAL